VTAPDLDGLYERRFPPAAEDRKETVWVEICRYLQRYVDPGGVVLDVACDRGYFIRNIRAGEKWATDLRDMSAGLGSEIRFVQANGLELLGVLPNGHFDVVFMSNYLEHLPSPQAVIDQLAVARGLLRPGGRVIVVQPNIRFVGAAYWDFIDHKVALTERSLVEAAESVGFRTSRVVPRFLPYTTRSRMPQAPWLVRAYLAIPLAWRLLGKQTLYIGERPAAP
jgi:2-polyprenyl-3-methyl-5-hydroxy-6-metoxy-1,4-benzoquinol methylase